MFYRKGTQDLENKMYIRLYIICFFFVFFLFFSLRKV
nr:MAG TPA: putative bacteriocin [Caudoviricetes sp.]